MRDAASRIAFRKGATVSDPGQLYLSIEGLSDVRCTVLSQEDDTFRPKLEWFTDVGNNVPSDVWGTTDTATIGIRQPGNQGSPVNGCAAYAVLCL